MEGYAQKLKLKDKKILSAYVNIWVYTLYVNTTYFQLAYEERTPVINFKFFI